MFHAKKRFSLILLGFAALFVFTHSNALEVQGHRGARSVLPENSLPAFQYALEIGVDTLELDTVMTDSGVIVVTHDQQINPTICQYKNGAKVKKGVFIRQLSLTEIKQFDCGKRANPRFKKQILIAGTEIPTLDEVFDLVTKSNRPNAKDIGFNIETKVDSRNPPPQAMIDDFVKSILDLVDEYNLERRVTLQSFDHRTLLAAHRLKPKLSMAALYRKNLADWVTPTLAAKATIVSPHFRNINADEVTAIHKAGLTVIPWVANTPKDWKKLIEMGVDGIISDNPKPLLEMLGRN